MGRLSFSLTATVAAGLLSAPALADAGPLAGNVAGAGNIAIASPVSTSGAAGLAVEIDGLRSAEGVVRIAVFDQPDAFPRGTEIAGQEVAAAQGSVTAVFDGLPPGRYAIAFYHDEDGNGEFDTNFVGLPLEGFGFSNDAPVVFGPPAFDDAAIEVSQGLSWTSVRVRY